MWAKGRALFVMLPQVRYAGRMEVMDAPTGPRYQGFPTAIKVEAYTTLDARFRNVLATAAKL
ncbi:MAG: hypothetical protein ACKPKO_33410, partial [Candidatus Fonsibacter sp.]